MNLFCVFELCKYHLCLFDEIPARVHTQTCVCIVWEAQFVCLPQGESLSAWGWVGWVRWTAPPFPSEDRHANYIYIRCKLIISCWHEMVLLQQKKVCYTLFFIRTWNFCQSLWKEHKMAKNVLSQNNQSLSCS